MPGEIFAVGFGGFLGSCLRFMITKLTGPLGFPIPLGTLVSNAIAGIAIGFIIGIGGQSIVLPPKLKLFLTTGLLGGLSTFSTFSLETVSLFNDTRYFLAAGNILLNLGLSLFGVVLGMNIAKWFFCSVWL